MAQKDGFDGFTGVTCRGIEHVADCPKNEVPKLKGDNIEFFFYFSRILPGLVKGEGGYDFNAVAFIFDLYEIPYGKRKVYHDKIMMVISVIDKYRKAAMEKMRSR